MDKLKDLLDEGNPLITAFIIDAAITKAGDVIRDGLADWPKHCLISRNAWLATAEKCLEALA